MAIESIPSTSQPTGTTFSSYIPSCKTVIKVVTFALLVFSANGEPAAQQCISRSNPDTTFFEALNPVVVNGTTLKAQNQYCFVGEKKEAKENRKSSSTRFSYEYDPAMYEKCLKQYGPFWGILC